MPTKVCCFKIYVTRQRNVTVTVMFLERPRPIQQNEREGEIERILTIYEIIDDHLLSNLGIMEKPALGLYWKQVKNNPMLTLSNMNWC